MEKHAFSGARPVACLRFLSAFKKALDDENIPEGAALRIWPNFLTGDAHELFNQLTEDGDAYIGGFTTYPQALQFFLRTYATNRHLEDAVERIDRLQQTDTETPKQFYRRLMTAARDLSWAFSQNELMTRFTRGLHRSVRSVLQEQRRDFTGLNALAEFADRATAITESHSALTAARARRTTALAVEEAQLPPGLLRTPHDTTYTADPVALADGYAPHPPTRTPSLTADLEYSEQSEKTASIAYSRESAPPSLHDYTDDINLVANTPNARQHTPRWRPEGLQSRAIIGDICFTCYIEGHRSPECPQKDRMVLDPLYLKWVSDNFNRLANWQQGWLESIGRAFGQTTNSASHPFSLTPQNASALRAPPGPKVSPSNFQYSQTVPPPPPFIAGEAPAPVSKK